jgi:hypothetical protein
MIDLGVIKYALSYPFCSMQILFAPSETLLSVFFDIALTAVLAILAWKKDFHLNSSVGGTGTAGS